jgi:hypothetical protein
MAHKALKAHTSTHTAHKAHKAHTSTHTADKVPQKFQGDQKYPELENAGKRMCKQPEA